MKPLNSGDMTPIEELIEMYEKFKGLMGGVSIESVIEHLKRAKDKETQMLDQLKAKHEEDGQKKLLNFMIWYKNFVPIGTNKSSSELVEQYYNETFK